MKQTVFEDADDEGVVTLVGPPGSGWSLLWPREVQAQVLGRRPLHHLLLVPDQHLPADDVQLPDAEDYPTQPQNKQITVITKPLP